MLPPMPFSYCASQWHPADTRFGQMAPESKFVRHLEIVPVGNGG